MILAGVVFNFAVTGALLRPIDFYAKRRDKRSEKPKEEKYEVNTNGNIKSLEGELTLLVEENGDTDRRIKFHRSHEQLPIEPTERFRTFSDASGMKKFEKIHQHKKDQSSSIRSLKHIVDSLTKNELVMLGSTMDIDGSLCSFPGAHMNSSDKQHVTTQTNTKSSHEFCCATIPRTITSIFLQIFNKHILCNRLFMMFMLVACMSIVGMAQINMFLPAHSEDIGISKKDVALLLTIMGSLDLYWLLFLI